MLQPNKINKWVLTPEGLDYAKNGTPEYKLYSLSSKEGTPVEKVQEALKDYKIALGNAMKKKLVTIKDQKLFRAVEEYNDTDQTKLMAVFDEKVIDLSEDDKKTLKSRKLAEEKQITWYKITKGPSFQLEVVNVETELTSDLIKDNKWENYKFKPFNLNALGAEVPNGNLHPLMKVREQFRLILLELGFE